MIFNILEEAGSLKGNAQIEFLKNHRSNERLQFFLEVVCTDVRLKCKFPSATCCKNAEEFDAEESLEQEMRNAIANLFGTDELRSRLTNLAERSTNFQLKWIKRIWNKKLRIGIGKRVYEKVWGKPKTNFSVCLCKKWKGKEFATDEWIAEPKLDGVRCIILIDQNGNAIAKSRNGKVLPGAKHVAQILGQKVSNIVLDGEIVYKDFRTSVSLVKSESNWESSKLIFHAFDGMPYDLWPQTWEKDIKFRKRWLREQLSQVDSKNIELVPSFLISEKGSDFDGAYPNGMDAFENFVSQGYEGAVFKRIESFYKHSRTSDWLKFKPVKEDDFVILEVLEGEGRFKGILGSIVVDVDGVKVNCGSGFDDNQRKEFWDDRAELIGKIAEIRYDNKTPDGSLRFPIFKTIRFDKTGE